MYIYIYIFFFFQARGELALALYLTTKEAILTPTDGTRLFALRMDSDNTQWT